jgi:predicted phage-related endonuclease
VSAATAAKKPAAKRVRKSMSAEDALLLAKPAAMPDRAQFIGGSDAAAVLGVSDWMTPLELFQKKVGTAPPEKPNPRLDSIRRAGHELEPHILRLLLAKLREQGLEVELLARNARYVDQEHTFLGCEIDFELRITGTVLINGSEVYFDGEHINGDCKSSQGFWRWKWGAEGSDDVPIAYAAQFMHGLGITKRRWCIVAALIGLHDVAIFWVRHDAETIAAMREKEVAFWLDHVQTKVEPDPLKFSDIRALFPQDNGRTVEATAEVATQVERIQKLERQVAITEAEIEDLKVSVGEYVGDFMRLTVQGREVLTFKRQRITKLDAQALRRQHPGLAALFEKTQEVRVLRFKPRR